MHRPTSFRPAEVAGRIQWRTESNWWFHPFFHVVHRLLKLSPWPVGEAYSKNKTNQAATQLPSYPATQLLSYSWTCEKWKPNDPNVSATQKHNPHRRKLEAWALAIHLAASMASLMTRLRSLPKSLPSLKTMKNTNCRKDKLFTGGWPPTLKAHVVNSQNRHVLISMHADLTYGYSMLWYVTQYSSIYQ